jgi:hypothetical protein
MGAHQGLVRSPYAGGEAPPPVVGLYGFAEKGPDLAGDLCGAYAAMPPIPPVSSGSGESTFGPSQTPLSHVRVRWSDSRVVPSSTTSHSVKPPTARADTRPPFPLAPAACGAAMSATVAAAARQRSRGTARQQSGTYVHACGRRRARVESGHNASRSLVRPCIWRAAAVLAGGMSHVVALKVGGSSPLGHPKLSLASRRSWCARTSIGQHWAIGIRRRTGTDRPGIRLPPPLRPRVPPERCATFRPPARPRGGRPSTGDRPWRWHSRGGCGH